MTEEMPEGTKFLSLHSSSTLPILLGRLQQYSDLCWEALVEGLH